MKVVKEKPKSEPRHVCKVSGCLNKAKHLFPKKPETITKWLEALQIEHFKPGFRICSAHFRPCDYGKSALKPNAVPSLCLPHKVYRTKVRKIELKMFAGA